MGHPNACDGFPLPPGSLLTVVLRDVTQHPCAHRYKHEDVTQQSVSGKKKFPGCWENNTKNRTCFPPKSPRVLCEEISMILWLVVSTPAKYQPVNADHENGQKNMSNHRPVQCVCIYIYICNPTISNVSHDVPTFVLPRPYHMFRTHV